LSVSNSNILHLVLCVGNATPPVESGSSRIRIAHPISGSLSVINFSTCILSSKEARVCGCHVLNISDKLFIGLFDKLPPGSIEESFARIKDALDKYSGNQARFSNAHNKPV